ncbi:2829_t:CDS:2 [Ambispora gerdemannii]|uniref:2829_t:CDS:1 n=1 Tax=Ambispora gerdemannii TaxID=144530 RepID=A0A9N9H5B7_9GLOM|nr:2829_t:CDS:2 [Ambispora gerdemannii]
MLLPNIQSLFLQAMYLYLVMGRINFQSYDQSIQELLENPQNADLVKTIFYKKLLGSKFYLLIGAIGFEHLIERLEKDIDTDSCRRDEEKVQGIPPVIIKP